MMRYQVMAMSRVWRAGEPLAANGAPGAVSMRGGKPFSVAGFSVRGGRIVAMDILVDPERLRALDLTALES